MWVLLLVLVIVTGVKQSQLLVPRLKSGLGTGVSFWVDLKKMPQSGSGSGF